MDNLYKAEIAPTINRCAVCHQSEQDHQSKKRKPKDGQQYVRDQSLPEWKGWHAFRRGLATNLTDLGVRPEVIQRILRHGDLATTMRYVKTRAHRINDAMATLEAAVPAQPVLRDTFGTLTNETGARPVASQLTRYLQFKSYLPTSYSTCEQYISQVTPSRVQTGP